MKKLLALIILCASASSLGAFVLDWDKIEHWTGEGPNRAALVVQFLDEYSPVTYVWGYRWEDGETVTGERLVRDIARGSDHLVAYIQFTGSMGCTLDGLGVSTGNSVLDYLKYDYDSAAKDPYISFGYDEPSTLMGQTWAPEKEQVLQWYEEAIEKARETHVIDNPLNQHVFGYPAYDYDWLRPTETSETMRWNSGWYTGYWSYWLGTEDTDEFTYSGLGMSSVIIENGAVNGWKFMPLDGVVSGDDWDAVSAATEWNAPDYSHKGITTGITDSPVADGLASDLPESVDIYRLDGSIVAKDHRFGTPLTLAPGIYIARSDKFAKKFIIRK